MKRKILSALFALVLVVTLGLVTAAPVAAGTPVEGTTCEIVGIYNPVNFTVTDDGLTVTWTFDMIGDKELSDADKIGGGRWNYGLAISLDGVQPAFQIHNNDGADNSFAVGTHLYSPYLDGWQATMGVNTPVDDLDWVTCTGDAYISPGEYPWQGGTGPVAHSSGNPEGIFTVTIDKAELGLEFYWAIWCTAGGFWEINGMSSYPEGFMWQEDVAAGHYELCSLPGAATDLSATVPVPPEQVIGISVDQTAIGFGSINPGDSSAARTVTVTNTGNVAEDFTASLANISSPDVYTTGLEIGDVGHPETGALVSDWVKENVAEQVSVAQDLILTVSAATAPGTYTATLVFWAEAAQ